MVMNMCAVDHRESATFRSIFMVSNSKHCNGLPSILRTVTNQPQMISSEYGNTRSQVRAERSRVEQDRLEANPIHLPQLTTNCL